jgi:hypothetical protein
LNETERRRQWATEGLYKAGDHDLQW